MDLPVDEWKSYILQKWSLLPKSIQVTISTAETLSDIFLFSSSLLQPEDEMFLKRLSRGYLVEKDPNAPLFYREEGNKKFQKKDYMGATVLYSKGVSHSSPNSEDISLCYANRSAALFHLGQYETCLKDIVRAQTHGYPERLQPKLLLRKAECLVTLGRPHEASQTISDLESNFVAKPTLAASQFQVLQRTLCRLKVKVQEKENLTETSPAALTKAFEDMDLREENEQISNTSSSVGLCMDPLKGRYLVATKDILPGELLVKEDAFVSVLNPGEMPPWHHGLESKWDTRATNGDLYCHRCLKHTLAPVPCDGCSYANLLPHTGNHSPVHKFLCALSASALCRQLEAVSLQAFTTGLKSSKLKAAAVPVLYPELNIWGVAMLRHMLQLQCNAQAITTIQQTGSEENLITDSRQVRLATGLFPVISLLNHSCSPNTSVSFISTVATVRASQQIRKGQEILHCYGPHESRMGVAERCQKLRSQYFFDCTCPACEREKQRPSQGPGREAFCCHRCSALLQGDDVLSCGSTSCTESVSRDHLVSQLQDLRQQVGMARKLLRNGKLERAIQLLLGCRHDAESFLLAEHSVVGEIEDGLAQAYAALDFPFVEGDWEKSATHLQKSLRVVEVRHGPSSVEMGHELFKLAQIFFNGFAIPEALNTIQQAEKVLLVHCGPWNDEIQELQQMRSCLLDLLPIPVGPNE
ncbi:SET and MYND domain-containing protein 4 isoform X4 [Mesoplodon densirostris]|uniref:SET and MYND domain-containing protein 4 isoform X4 n=1 Tax=Mesoplodon densirostris TaxID=48708 RepID=UPI0028DBC9BB|nr:SET and MYND domain-containing protein 4 isoform X4 [Mesoplodon densirostris]